MEDPQQYALELNNIKEHGAAYPTMYEYEWNFEAALSAEIRLVFPKITSIFMINLKQAIRQARPI